MDSGDGELWKKAMDEEMEAFDKNESWDLVEFLLMGVYGTPSMRREDLDRGCLFNPIRLE